MTAASSKHTHICDLCVTCKGHWILLYPDDGSDSRVTVARTLASRLLPQPFAFPLLAPDISPLFRTIVLPHTHTHKIPDTSSSTSTYARGRLASFGPPGLASDS